MKTLSLLLLSGGLLFSSSSFVSATKEREAMPASARMGVIPSESDMTKALKEALETGAGNAVSYLNKPGGYLDNARFKIPFPQDAQNVANKARQLGMGKQVDEFVERMNRGAEDAAAAAKPIFINAISSMSLTDGKNILLGANDAATQYFKVKTTNDLTAAFAPSIKAALDKMEATKYWAQITTRYNKLPMVKPVQTDLVKYTTGKALDGLFMKMADEEKDLRSKLGSVSGASSVMKSVFSWAAGAVKK